MTLQTILNAALEHGLDLIVAICLALVAKYAIPLLQKKTDAQDLDYIKTVIKTAVAAAEERFVGDKLGLDVRKPWVKALLEGLGIVVDDLIDAMIDEAARALTATSKLIEKAAAGAAAESPIQIPEPAEIEKPVDTMTSAFKTALSPESTPQGGTV